MSMNLSPNAPPPLPVGPNQAMSMVHQLSDQQLLQMIQHPGSPVMQQSALQEMQFRHQARTGPGAMQQQAQQPQHPMAAQANQGVQQNLAQGQVDKLGGGIGQLPAQAVEGMAAGGIVNFDSGGATTPPQSSGFWNSLFGPTYAGQDTGQGFFPINGPTGGYAHPVAARAPTPYAAPVDPDQELAAQYAAAGLDYPSQQIEQHQVQAQQQRVAALQGSGSGPGYQDANDVRAARAAGRPVPLQPQPAELGTTTSAEAPSNTPTPSIDDKSWGAVFGRPFQDRFDTPDPAAGTLDKQMAATEAAKRANSGLAMLHMGAAMLQSTSPFAAVALGKGVDAYATSKEAGQAAEQAGLAHIAQQQGEQYKSQMQYAGSVDAQMAHAYGMYRMQYLFKDLQLSQQAQVAAGQQFEQAYKALEPMYTKQIEGLSVAAMGGDPKAVMQLEAARANFRSAVEQLTQDVARRAAPAHSGQVYPQGGGGQQPAPAYQHQAGTPPQ